MKIAPLLILCTLGLLPSCSYHSASLPKLSEIKKMRFSNPFRAKVPVRSVSEEELAGMQDFSIASHNASGMPDDSVRPVDFTPSELPKGYDLLSASLLPSKSGESVAVINADGTVPEHKPIIPMELLDEEDEDFLSLETIMDEEPLVPDAPQTVEISESEALEISTFPTEEEVSQIIPEALNSEALPPEPSEEVVPEKPSEEISLSELVVE